MLEPATPERLQPCVQRLKQRLPSVRMSLRGLASRTDAADFTQVNRSVMVNTDCTLGATRDGNGHDSLSVRGLRRSLKVSRALGHLFRAM